MSDEWINRLFSPDVGSMYQGDFRTLASHYFQLLTTFCSHVNRSTQDALDDFYSETLLSPYVLLPDSLSAQMEKQSEFLQLSINNSVHQLLELVRTNTQANVLQTAFSIPTRMGEDEKYSNDSLININVIFITAEFSWKTACLCVANRSCSWPSSFLGSDLMEIAEVISSHGSFAASASGFFVGCSALESLLQSTLECLFDSSCLETIHTFIPSSNITGIYILNKNQTRFDPKTSVERLMNHLFIEKWLMNHSFFNYYSQCAPMLCTYTVVQRNNALYVITHLLAFEGGLTAVLRFCIPLIISWWRKRRHMNAAESRRSEYFCLVLLNCNSL